VPTIVPVTGIETDPRPDLIVDKGPEGKGVGQWVPKQKHVLLAKYLLATRYAWKKWPHRVLIDPFCGPGRIQVKEELFTRDGGVLLAWRQSQAGGAPFTQVCIGDIDAQRLDAAEARLGALGASVSKFSGPAIEAVPKMRQAIPPNALAFAYFDPYNLELLSFSLIEQIAQLKNVDFAVHFSTMDLSRNVEFEFDPTRARFDDTAPGWRKNVDVLGSTKAAVPAAFFKYWCGLVRGLGFSFSKEMPLVFNDRGHAIYRLVFFSRHQLPTRVWADVARGPNRNLDLGD